MGTVDEVIRTSAVRHRRRKDKMGIREELKFEVVVQQDENGNVHTRKKPVLDPLGRQMTTWAWADDPQRDRTIRPPEPPKVPSKLGIASWPEGPHATHAAVVAEHTATLHRETPESDLTEEEQAFLGECSKYFASFREYERQVQNQKEALAEAEARRQRKREKTLQARARGAFWVLS